MPGWKPGGGRDDAMRSADDLMVDVRGALNLDGRVVDPKLAERSLDGIEDLTVGMDPLGDDDVARGQGLCSVGRPHVEIVHGGDVRQSLHGALHRYRVNGGGHTVEEHVHRVAEQSERTGSTMPAMMKEAMESA